MYEWSKTLSMAKNVSRQCLYHNDDGATWAKEAKDAKVWGKNDVRMRFGRPLAAASAAFSGVSPQELVQSNLLGSTLTEIYWPVQQQTLGVSGQRTSNITRYCEADHVPIVFDGCDNADLYLWKAVYKNKPVKYHVGGVCPAQVLH